MQELVKKINNKLKDTGWYAQLRMFLESSDFLSIINELKKKVEEDKQRFCPSLSTSFAFLESIPFDDIKAIVFTDYVSNKLIEANGIPFSSNDVHSIIPITVYQSVDEKGKKNKRDSIDWVKQGVLIIPLGLTSRIEGRAHLKLWEPFIMRIIESVNRKYPKIPWVLMGSGTWKYEEDIISPHVRKMELKNYTIDNQWSQWINTILIEQSKLPIKW